VARVLLAEGGVVDVPQVDGLARLEVEGLNVRINSWHGTQEHQVRKKLTAYAMRSPLASHESCVGWPRVVAGDAAKIFSSSIDMADEL
jgi:hypothetical protein